MRTSLPSRSTTVRRPTLASAVAGPVRACGRAALGLGLLLALAARPAAAATPPAATTAELTAAIGAAAAATAEPGALESRLQSIERLSKRDPQRALGEIAQLDRSLLSARGEVRLAAARARLATFQYRMQEALALVDEALPRARSLGDPSLLALLLGCRATALHEMNRGAEALAAGDEARTLADRAQDDELRVDARIFLVDYAARRGDYERAFAQLEEAEQIARRHGGPGLRAAVAYTGAALANSIDDVSAAIAGYKLAEPAFREDGDALGEADAARRLAGLLVGAGRYTEALDLLQRALARYHALRDDYGIAVATALLARATAGSGRSEQGLLISDEAIAALRATDASDALAAALLDRVQIKLAAGRTQGVAARLDEARALLLRSDELRLRMRFQSVAAEAYAALGRYKEAHAALADLLQLRERYDDQRLSRQLAAQRGRLESQRMAAELERARSEGERHRAALADAEQAARWQTALVLMAAVAALLALVALVRITHRGRRDATLAQTDFLTGIQNRRRITELGQRLLAECGGRGDPFSVLLLDLDHFKSINDDYGHQAGDRALKAVADELKRHLRRGDELGRYGGEEFAAVLPATSPERALAIGERLRIAVASLPAESLGLERPLTVSVGVATRVTETEFGDLVARADGALYAAKEAGRNRVEIAGDAPAEAGHGRRADRREPAAAPRASVASIPTPGRAALSAPLAQAE